MVYFLLLLCAFYPLRQEAIQIEQSKKYPESASYKVDFIDLGETNLNPNQLGKHALPVSYAPKINDQRQVNCNQISYGVIKGPSADSISPQISSSKSKCYDVNNAGDLLLSFKREPLDGEWWIWTQQDFTKIGAHRIDLAGINGNDLHLRSINDKGLAVGVFQHAGMYKPILWSLAEGIHPLSYYLGWDIDGVFLDVNQSGSVVGYAEEEGIKVPFIWNKSEGLNRLKGMKLRLKEINPIELEEEPQFVDMLVSDENLLYGTFKYDNSSDAPTYAFWWDPKTDSFRLLDFQGMRLNAINADNTLVGSWKEQAALCDLGGKPVHLSDLVPTLGSEWKLIEATDINAHGDIVGYGSYRNKPHYFMLKRQNS